MRTWVCLHPWITLFITTLVVIHMELCICSGGSNNTSGVCKEAEKQALLRFKRELQLPSRLLSSWVDGYGADCCRNWEGVVCDQVSGHVVELLPSWPWPTAIFNFSSSRLDDSFVPKGRLSSSLLQLKQLRHLDLSGSLYKYLKPSEIPTFIGSLVKLQYLDLSHAGFQGIIPHQLGNLSSLHTLQLKDGSLKADSLDWVFSLQKLEVLELTFVNLSMAHNWPEVIYRLPSLRELDLNNCSLPNNKLPNPLLHHNNSSSLQLLDLSHNEFNSVIPRWILNLTSLESLDLSYCGFLGPLLDSSWNLTSLVFLDLRNNKLHGTISSSISNLTALRYLFLSGNMLTGEIPKEIGMLSELRGINLAGNKLSGPPLDESFGRLFPKIQSLVISDNMLEGIVTESFFSNLSMMNVLKASGNRLTLNVSPNWMPPFQLWNLQLRGWNLGPQFPVWLQSQRRLRDVDISQTGIEGEIPRWFWNFSSDIIRLNLSHNKLHGEIPTITFPLVSLASNQFSGPLPGASPIVTALDLSNNSFSGNLYDFLCHPHSVSNHLKMLHLGMNGLSGRIPNCWMHWPELRVILMEGNSLIGSIPDSIGLLNQLKSLDLHKNLLSGHMPSSLQNCSLLFKVDLGENRFTGSIPGWLGSSLSKLAILRLRSNEFYGELPLEICHLSSLHILDLSSNNLFGGIPRCLRNLTAMINGKGIQDEEEIFQIAAGYLIFATGFGESALVTTKGNEYEYSPNILRLLASMDLSSNNFTGIIPIELSDLVALRFLNLSRNNLAGSIPKKMGNMKSLESLDLSDNRLSSEIPATFSSLNYLGVLNLSYNDLSGKVPSGTQLQGFNASSYVGNNLFGPPISHNCSVDASETPNDENRRDDDDDDDDDDDSEVDWFYVSMAIGFVVGLWGVFVFFILVSSWRIAYFQFLDKMLNSCFCR